MVVNSTGQCNAFCKYHGWSAKVERLSWSRVELLCHGIQGVLRKDGQIRAVGEVLPQETIRVFVGATLPRAFGIAEVDGDVGGDGKAAMMRHLHPPIPHSS